MRHAVTLLLLAGCGCLVASPAAAQDAQPSVEERVERLERLFERLAAENESLRQENAELKARLEATDERVEAVADASELQLEAAPAGRSVHVGGYGEMHVNRPDDGANQIDFHRFVIFLGHDFSERTRFFSELEVEHSIAGDGQVGEVELEQAYIEHDLSERSRARFGLFLIPVGILNETHEPNTFYGVERNPVETNIIPTTWWEGGIGYRQRFGLGWSLDLAVTSGLDVPLAGGNAFKIRNGRQKVGKAKMEDLAYSGRIEWTGLPGVRIAATVQVQEDVTQGALGIGATLIETHTAIQRGRFGLRALFARWDLSGSATEVLGRDRQDGFYLEPSYEITTGIGLFARYSEWDNEAGSRADTRREQLDLGISYWLHPNVVLKMDFMDQSGAANGRGFNLGVGYSFP